MAMHFCAVKTCFKSIKDDNLCSYHLSMKREGVSLPPLSEPYVNPPETLSHLTRSTGGTKLYGSPSAPGKYKKA